MIYTLQCTKQKSNAACNHGTFLNETMQNMDHSEWQTVQHAVNMLAIRLVQSFALFHSKIYTSLHLPIYHLLTRWVIHLYSKHSSAS